MKAVYYIRYADDFVILHTDKQVLENYLQNISEFLNTNLKLYLHPNKVSINTYASGIDFLGYLHFPKHRALRTATKKRMFRNLKNNDYSDASVASYLGMLKHGNTFTLQGHIEKEIS